MTEKGDDYIKALQVNGEDTKAYYQKSIVKTEQQKFLEKLLLDTKMEFSNIADIACGGGSLAYHLKAIYPKAHFTLSDYNAEALVLAKELNGKDCTYLQGNIYDFSEIADHSFDLVCCWQTLSWLDEPQKALSELVRITKPGGKIFASSLFNIDHDVDIFAKVLDHTRPNGKMGIPFSYNTYSAKTVANWLEGKAKHFELHKFVPSIDFHYDGKGVGTFTVQTEKERLQISGGYLMNWAILEITK